MVSDKPTKTPFAPFANAAAQEAFVEAAPAQRSNGGRFRIFLFGVALLNSRSSMADSLLRGRLDPIKDRMSLMRFRRRIYPALPSGSIGRYERDR